MSGVIKLSSPATQEYWEISVLFEDSVLLAVDKPARLLTSPDRYDPERPNLMRLLHKDIARGTRWATERQITYLANAHRLDFETSGVLLLAKTKPALIDLADQFGSGKPHKTYAALVGGTPLEPTFQIEVKLGPHPTRPGIVRPDPKNGKKSLTNFEISERFQHYTLLTCRPVTGRTHQIRVHLKHAHLPIVGDLNYGGRQLCLSWLKKGYRLKPNRVERPLIDRVALHAERLEVLHPTSRELISITAPLPKDLTVALKYLRKFDAPS